MPRIANVALLVHQHVARAIMVLVQIMFCIKELFISAALARPHSFLGQIWVLVLVKAEGGVAIYLRYVGAGPMALVWYMGKVVG